MAIRESTEQRLLDAADDLFFTRGIAATPIDAVIERAGVSAATLYRGFPSKEALVAAALERRHLEWIETWDAAIARAADDEERALAVFDALDDFRDRPIGSRWCAFLGTAAEYGDAPPEVAEAVRRDSDALRSRLRNLAAPLVAPRSRDDRRRPDDGTDHRASRLGDELLLLVTGDLAMRLREPGHRTDTARGIARVLIASAR
ncbi:TetR/AcrR family transcriptional regulator [Labedella phragmitis]|uniref:TetR/AcrR family transcriptional regulator n=1 Tax=Labedella phragmitis TaxID=2498849 RepID=A0A3S4AL61_9MICO|nr:TetR/AcrR family transcriptional regulator [Labedella phragmitis]RWZ51038.1 TetR/AcrR family transcriptional regulator [Labedella phragmitis]